MGVFDRDEKTWKDLDCEKVNFEFSSVSKDPEAGHWGWGCGGAPHEDHEYSISRVDDQLSEVRYKMPDCINRMLRIQAEHAAEKARRDIRYAMGCHSYSGDSKCPLEKEEAHEELHSIMTKLSTEAFLKAPLVKSKVLILFQGLFPVAGILVS